MSDSPITDFQFKIPDSQIPPFRLTRSHFSAAFTFIVVIAAVVAFRATGSVHWAPLELGLAEGLLKILLWVAPCLAAIMAFDRTSLHEAWRAIGLDDQPGYLF